MMDIRRNQIVWGLIIGITIAFLFLIPEKKNLEGVTKGSVEYQQGRPILLAGDWAFKWQGLLTLEDIEKFKEDETAYVSVPDVWNRYTDIVSSDGVRNGYGYGTYWVKITGLTPEETYGLRIRNISTAQKVYVNNQLLVEMGKVSTEAESAQSNYNVSYMAFTAKSTEVTIIVQASNYEYARGGFWFGFTFGEKSLIENIRLTKFAEVCILVGILLAVWVICLIFAIMSSKRRAAFYLASGTFLMLLYILVTGDKVIFQLFPDIGNRVVRIQYGVMFLVPISIIGYVNAVATGKRAYMKRLFKVITLYGIATTLCSMFCPIYRLTRLTYTANFMTILLVSAVILGLIIERIVYKSNVGLLIISFYVLGLGLLHDFFYSANVIYSRTGEILIVAYVVFIIMLTVYLAQNIKRTYERSMALPIMEQAYLNAQIKPHFLFNVLNSVVSLIVTSPDKAEEMVMDLSTHMRHLLGSDNRMAMIELEEELRRLEAYVRIEQRRFPTMEVVYSIEEDLYIQLPPFTIQPLVENAIKHGLGPGSSSASLKIEVIVCTAEEGVRVCVKDDGVGMTSELLEAVNAMLGDHHNHGGSVDQHIGLRNVNERLIRNLDTVLNLKSVEGKGTEVFFTINDRWAYENNNS